MEYLKIIVASEFHVDVYISKDTRLIINSVCWRTCDE